MIYYDELVAITEDYLGPAAKRFVDRQIAFHLEKKAGELTKEDVMRLSEWMQVTLGMLTSDKKSVDEAGRRIKELAK